MPLDLYTIPVPVLGFSPVEPSGILGTGTGRSLVVCVPLIARAGSLRAFGAPPVYMLLLLFLSRVFNGDIPIRDAWSACICVLLGLRMLPVLGFGKEGSNLSLSREGDVGLVGAFGALKTSSSSMRPCWKALSKPRIVTGG